MAALLAFVLAQVGVGLAVEGPNATAAPCPGVLHDGAVTKISSPDGRVPTAYAVDALAQRRMFVTDGVTIHRSTNGGCSWARVYSAVDPLPSNPVSSFVTIADRVSDIALASNGTVYATLSPCQARKLAPAVPGCGVLASVDDGAHWTVSTEGLPVDVTVIDALAVSPADPRTVHLLVDTTTGEQQYVSVDRATTWTERSAQPSPPLAVDPLDPDDLWAGGSPSVLHSTDGGVTWHPVPYARGTLTAIDVAHPAGRPATVTIVDTGGTMTQSSDGGQSWSSLPGAPQAITSVTHGRRAGELAVTTDPSGPSAGAPWVFSPGRGWRRIPAAFRERDATTNRTSPSSYWFADPDLPGILGYDAARPAGARGPDDIQGAAGLGETAGTPRSCYHGPGSNNPPAKPGGPVTPAPAGEGPILVDNFDTGCLVSFDRYGHSRVLLQAPPWSEGVALTFDRQLDIATRFSNELLRTLLPKQAFTVLDNNLDNAESPTYDRYGNLYAVDNLHNAVYVYPYPQVPGEPRELVWSFRGFEFIEDIRIAPPGSPYAGDLFVEYAADGKSGGNPDAIAILRHTARGWRRLPDFCHFPPNFLSASMAFLPDGSLLVPDFSGSGLILEYAPDGRSLTTFATVASTPGDQYSFTKIDIAASGYVYVSSDIQAAAAAGAAVDPDRRDTGGGGAYYTAGTHNAIVRFDPTGRRLLPDFTENLSYPVGIAVPNVITGLPRLVLPRPDVSPPRGVPAPAPPPPPAPPVQPVPGPAAAPGGLPVPAAGPAAQGQPQANPVSQVHQAAQPIPQLGMVVQPESRVQVAVARADGPAPQQQADHQLTALRGSRVPAPAPALVLFAGAAVLLGCATRSRVQPAYSRSSPVVSRRRRRVRVPRKGIR